MAGALTDGQIVDLTYDHFRPVYEEYAAGMSRDDKARRLVDYASRQQRENELIRLVAQLNPAAYEAHRRQPSDASTTEQGVQY